MEIDQAIHPEASAVREERMTVGLALPPIPAVVHANGPQRPTHAHRRSKPDQRPLQPFGTLETAVNEAPVEANGVAGAKRNSRRDHKDGQRAPRKCKRTEYDGPKQHCAIPQGAPCIPNNRALDRRRLVQIGQRIDFEKIVLLLAHHPVLRFSLMPRRGGSPPPSSPTGKA